MKTILSIIAAVFLVASCGKKEQKSTEDITYEAEAKTPIEQGKELFDGPGNCYACHQEDQKVIAPSLVEIATIYKAKNADMVEFLKGEGDPIVDPSQYETMKINFSITKKMTDDELKAIEAYVMSFSK